MENIKARAKRLKDAFNLSIEQWDIIDRFQGFVCWLCRKRQKSGKRLAVDHRHSDGLIRALLCSQCNRLLGKIESNGWTIDILKRLIDYFINPPAVQALGHEVFGFPGRTGTKRHRIWVRKQTKIAQKKRDVSQTDSGRNHEDS
jgi:recombination endonuclease VII